MDLSNLKPADGSVKNKKRLGRGEGSGRGGTSTKGHKGAQSRSGYKRRIGFEGGQMPLHRRVPKFGFKNINREGTFMFSILKMTPSIFIYCRCNTLKSLFEYWFLIVFVKFYG